MSDNLHAEVVVIGAGPGGYAAAFRSADLGKQVILIEKDSALGGVCLNRGCIPSKALLHLAKVIGDAKYLEKSGVTFGDPTLDLDAIRSWKESVVSKLSNGIDQLAKVRNVHVIRGTASFGSPTQLSVNTKDSSQSITFDNCIIATGSIAAGIPGFPTDHPRIINSTGALMLRNIPERFFIHGNKSPICERNSCIFQR